MCHGRSGCVTSSFSHSLFQQPFLFGCHRKHSTTRASLSNASVRPRLGVPPEIRAQFISPAIAAFVTFSVLGFYTALLPSLLAQSLQINNHAVAGIIVAGLFFVGTVTVCFTGKLKSWTG